MAYDTLQHRTLLFGGQISFVNPTFSEQFASDTWEWDGSNWNLLTPQHHPSARSKASLAFDPVANQVVLYGGAGPEKGGLDDTWIWDGHDWSTEPGSGR